MTMTEDAPVAAAPAPAPAEPQGKGKKGKKAKKDKEAKGKSNLVPAIVLALGVAAGGYFMGGGGDSAAASDVADAEDAAPEPGATIGLEPITVNLDGGRFLRVGVAFKMSADFEAVDDHGEYHFEAADQGRLRDQLIAMFAGRSSNSLVGAEQLADIKAELLERANTLFDGHALDVYLTDFVMQ